METIGLMVGGTAGRRVCGLGNSVLAPEDGICTDKPLEVGEDAMRVFTITGFRMLGNVAIVVAVVAVVVVLKLGEDLFTDKPLDVTEGTTRVLTIAGFTSREVARVDNVLSNELVVTNADGE